MIYFKVKILMLLFIIISCDSSNTILPVENVVVKYLHLGHTRTNENPLMDSIVEKIDYSKYEMLWLGGDLAYLTSRDEKTISHVDSIYNLSDSNTLVALGNHDYDNIDLVEEFTKRPAFYSYYKNGITFLILDTQDSLSNIIGEQKKLFNETIQNIQNSSHLIILHHKLIWMYGNTYLQPKINSISNGPFSDCIYCINPNNFNSELYPELVKIKERGIEVLCIGGDIGVFAKEFEYVTEDGIYFLASGINSGDIINKGLVFTHDVTNQKLSWEFKLLEEI
jgi:hypothetical protein